MRRVAVDGSAASVLSATVAAARSRSDTGAPLAAINAVSHWLHGASAYAVDRATWRHTPAGALIHHVSSFVWAALYEWLVGGVVRTQRDSDDAIRGVPSGADLVAGAVLVTGLAAWTDLRLVPPRLSPGFEHRLRPASVALVYVAFACGLAAGGLAQGRPVSAPR
ncbi:MAG: hypothetical protein JO090_05980 [Rhizobacter sp.]|nr:hypothetical protein [Rhizobacter sp.]